MRNFSMFTMIAILLLVMVSTNLADAVLLDTILLRSGGQLNGQVVDEANFIVEVQPGELLTGWINIRAYNGHAPTAVVPVAATFTWGIREDQPW